MLILPCSEDHGPIRIWYDRSRGACFIFGSLLASGFLLLKILWNVTLKISVSVLEISTPPLLVLRIMTFFCIAVGNDLGPPSLYSTFFRRSTNLIPLSHFSWCCFSSPLKFFSMQPLKKHHFHYTSLVFKVFGQTFKCPA